MNRWAALRLILLIANLILFVLFPAEKTNLDWLSGALISVSFSVILFGWLVIQRNVPEIDFYGGYSWTYPFYPLKRYPLQYCLLTSLCLVIGGGGAMIANIVTRKSSGAFGGTIFLWGIGIFLSLKIWQRLFSK